MARSDEWTILQVDTGAPSDLARAIAESPDPDAITKAKQLRREAVTYEAGSATEELRRAEEAGLSGPGLARLQVRAGIEQQERRARQEE